MKRTTSKKKVEAATMSLHKYFQPVSGLLAVVDTSLLTVPADDSKHADSHKSSQSEEGTKKGKSSQSSELPGLLFVSMLQKSLTV